MQKKGQDAMGYKIPGSVEALEIALRPLRTIVIYLNSESSRRSDQSAHRPGSL